MARETKYQLITALMAWNEEYHNCGRRGTRSYCELEAALRRKTKAELETLCSEFCDADDAKERGLW